MKMLKKLLIVLVISLLVFAIFHTDSFAAFDWKKQMNDVVAEDGDTGVEKAFSKISGAVITVARVICMGVAITMLVMVAIKYMSAAPGEKADIKKHAVIYVVGAVVMFASTGILGIIQRFAAGI